MASQTEIEARKAILRARGVPEAFIDNLANREGGSLRALWPHILWAVVMVSLLLWALLPGRFDPLIIPYIHAKHLDSVLYYTPSVSKTSLLLPLVFGFNFSTAALTALNIRFGRARPFPAYDTQALVLRNHPKRKPLSTIKPDPRFAKLAHLADDATFLTAIRHKDSTFITWFNLAVTLIAFVIFLVWRISDLSEYQRVTLTSVEVREGFKTQTHGLRDAKQVDILCYDFRKSVDFSYQLIYPDGEIELWQPYDYLHDYGSEAVLDRLDIIDNEITRLGIPIHRLPRIGNLGDEGKACVKHAAKLWGLKKPDTLRRLVFGP